MQFKNFVLDKFQEDAIASVEKNHSVVVSAATGTGKTLIADYVIDKFLKSGKKIVYTAPIKALSNQKYRDFKAEYGAENVGILTGDIQINHEAPVLIMTTEIFRNMLMTRDECILDVQYVIFDEIHFISDIERGTVWEESIIFAPEHIRFLCLSATIPNADQFAAWIQSIKKHTVDVVKYEKRAVPLKHLLYDVELGVTDAQRMKKSLELDKYPRYEKVMYGKREKKEFKSPYHIDLIRELKHEGLLPCIFFIMSRAQCEKKAEELSRKIDFIPPNKKQEIIQIFNKTVPSELRTMASVGKIKGILQKGVGIHHAGMFPKVKEAVELLFASGLVKVLYATETFAVGINMPAKAVCFSTLEKYDGINFRYMKSKEYFQMAGRAGRRGIDKEGFAIAMVERGFCDIEKIIKITSRDVEPIISQFTLSWNTALNLYSSYPPEEVELVLKNSFDYFLRKSENVHAHVMASYNNKIKVLKQKGCIKDDAITDKGRFLLHIYSEELLVTELFATELHKNFSEIDMNVLVASLAYEPRLADHFAVQNGEGISSRIIKRLKDDEYIMKNLNKKNLRRLSLLVSRWSEGCEFSELMKICDLQEGDIIRLFRRMIDLLRQIRKATFDGELSQKVTNCIDRIERDVVKVEF